MLLYFRQCAKKPRKWPRLSVCLMNDEEKITKTNEHFISVNFFL